MWIEKSVVTNRNRTNGINRWNSFIRAINDESFTYGTASQNENKQTEIFKNKLKFNHTQLNIYIYYNNNTYIHLYIHIIQNTNTFPSFYDVNHNAYRLQCSTSKNACGANLKSSTTKRQPNIKTKKQTKPKRK